MYNLTLPPSTNNLFTGGGSKGRFKSKRYKAWIDTEGWAIKAQGLQKVKGPVLVSIAALIPGGPRRDIDNIIKPTLDLLVSMGVIEADDWTIVKGVNAGWRTWGGPGMNVTVDLAF